MESINSFIKGLNKDLDPLVQNNQSYFHAENMRLNTEHGQTSPSLINILGNTFKTTVPNTTGVHRLSIIGTGAVNITIQGQTGAGLTVTNTTSTQDVYNYLISDVAYTNCVQNSSFSGYSINSYNIYYNNNYIYIVGAFISNTQNTITSSSSNNAIILRTNNYIPAQNSLIIIGSTYIRDNIYFFTTNNTTQSPGQINPSSVGQIWELLYDQITEVVTLNLLYNNYVDFTALHPIPHNACLGRYENSDAQRLYWTDNYNKLRSFNVKDPQGFALDVSLLDIRPSIDFSPPILQKIVNGGNLLVGVYQACYRLKNTGGAVTKISPISNLVNIVQSSEDTATGGGNFATYYGNPIGTSTGKAITWQIQDLDTDFDRIEIITIFRDILGNIPSEINIIKDEPIPSNGIYTFTFTGNEDPIALTLDDLSAIDDTFTHCKTIATKDNRLFAANLSLQNQELDYDARAYRFPISSNSFQITENSVTNTYTNTNWTTINSTSDAINANITTQLYKSNSTELGGSGPNISFDFGTIAVKCDSTITVPSAFGPGNPPFRHTNPDFTISQLDLDVKRIDNSSVQIYPINSINDDIKYPYYSSLLKGYERSENYRFGITFFDKSGRPYYTKWICDVKMPEHNDTNNNSIYEDGTSTGITDFRLSFTANRVGFTEAFVQQLFIRFNVSIPDSLSDIISGYTICRVERDIDNKTILGTGILNQTESDGGALYLPDTQNHEDSCPATFAGYNFLNIDLGTGAAGEALDTRINMELPEVLLGGFNGWRSGDKIRVISRATINAYSMSISGGEPYKMHKYYNIDATYSGSTNEFSTIEAGLCDTNGTFQYTGWLFHNYTRTETSASGGSDALGAKTLCVGLGSSLGFNATYGCTQANGKKLLAQYVRVISNQYGGNTYNARSNNDYISCSHFRPVRSYVTASGTTDTFMVFGGDVYTQIYDNQKEIKNWAGLGLGAYSSGDGCTSALNVSKISLTQFFPCTSSHNTDLRHGIHINKDLLLDDGTGASGVETQEYNTVYSNEQDIVRFFPKPSQVSTITEYDTRVWASEIKTNGELTDSWGIFLPDNYWDTEGSYGPINALDILQDKMFFWQDNAFGVLSINPRVLVTDNSSTTLQLGTGDVIQRHDYISTEHGTKHQWSVIKSPTSIVWYDVNVRKIMRFNGQLDQLSEIKGLRGYIWDNGGDYLQTYDNPIYSNLFPTYGCGIHGTYDYINNEFIITFLGLYNQIVDDRDRAQKRYFTIAYNEVFDAFTSFYSFTPNIYITNHREIYTPNSQISQSLYLHNRDTYNEFYGTKYQSKVTTIINTNPQYIKVFDNLEWITDSFDNTGTTNITGNTWSSYRVYNSHQNTDYQTLIIGTNIKRKERLFKSFVPRNRVLYTTQDADIFNDLSPTEKLYGERIRDNYIYLDLVYDNPLNYRFIFRLLKTIWRVSSR